MNKKTRKIEIYSDFITLGQFLKFADIVSTGGEVKEFLKSNTILINDELDNRRGRKLRNGDKIKVCDEEFEILKNDN